MRYFRKSTCYGKISLAIARKFHVNTLGNETGDDPHTPVGEARCIKCEGVVDRTAANSERVTAQSRSFDRLRTLAFVGALPYAHTV